jgi:DNA polymerase III subunit delta'
MARAPAVRENEAPPEADRLDGVPHPRETRALFGHADAERVLAQSLASGRLHHAWMITGPEGIGKATLAYRFARHALAKPSERDVTATSLEVAPETTAARQVLALSHPGLLVMRRPWDTKTKRHTASIPVDEVRRIKSFLGHTADAGQYRVVIVDSADELNINAANALLKSLEEPPTATVFLLVVSEPGRLLATIRSRCRTLDLKPLADTDLRRAVQEAFKSMEGDPPATSDWTRLAAMAEGSVRRLLALWQGNGLELSERIDRLLMALPRLDWSAIHTLGDELGSAAAAERFETFYDLLLLRLARLVGAAARGQAGGADTDMAMRLIGEARLATWAELWETIVREKSVALALNLDRKSLILDTFSRIEQAARPPRGAPQGLGV